MRRPAMLLASALVLLWSGSAGTAAADTVTPSERVKSRLNVRAEPVGGSRVVAGLSPGEELEWVATREGWHEVRLESGASGFVSAAFSVLVPAPAPEPLPLPVASVDPAGIEPRRGGLAAFFRRLFGGGAPVELVISQPIRRGSVYRHLDPELPVSGFARAPGTGRNYDVMLVLDASTSTNEYAEADIDGDGEGRDEWMGGDSIYKAQVAAAASFVRTVARLPFNADGRRIRVGIVVCAGEDRHRLAPGDRDLEITLDTIRWLAHRDARVVLPLTHDYGEAEQRLAVLWKETPVGMTNVAAGIGRAVIELTGDELRFAESEPRADADRVILFLSDGKPRLPYDKEKAERAAAYAGKLAASLGIRVNAFALGRDVVARNSGNWSLKRMARRTGGRHVQLARPAEIVVALQTTPFSVVDRVQVRNQTTGEQTPRIATGIDGSFYAEIGLREGDNEIEVEAQLDDGEAGRESFRIAYLKAQPTEELEAELADLRSENEALVERIRRRLVVEMEQRRAEQQRRVELSVRDGEERGEPDAAP